MALLQFLLMKLLYQTAFNTCLFEFQGINLEKNEVKVYELNDISRSCQITQAHTDAMNLACGNLSNKVATRKLTVASITCGHVNIDLLTSLLPVKGIFNTQQVSIEGWEQDVVSLEEPVNILGQNISFKQKIREFCRGTKLNMPCRHKAIRAIVQHALSGRSRATGAYSCFFTNIDTGYSPNPSETDFDDGIEIAALTKDMSYRMYTIGKHEFFELVVPNKSLKFVRLDGDEYYQALEPDCEENICYGDVLSDVISENRNSLDESYLVMVMELFTTQKYVNVGKIGGNHRKLIAAPNTKTEI